MEQEKLQDDLKTFRAQAQKLQNERKLLDIELEMSKKETLRFLLDKVCMWLWILLHCVLNLTESVIIKKCY